MANRTCSIEDCESRHFGRGYCHRHYASIIRRRKPFDDTSLARAKAKIERHADKSGLCWQWGAALNANGYGLVTVNIGNGERSELAHRVSYIVHVGAIPEGMDLDHRCHNTACVNPDHLRACPRDKNMENRGHAYGASGIRGVYPLSNGKWRAQAKKAGEIYRAGDFVDKLEAAEAARQLRLALFTHNDLDRIESQVQK